MSMITTTQVNAAAAIEAIDTALRTMGTGAYRHGNIALSDAQAIFAPILSEIGDDPMGNTIADELFGQGSTARSIRGSFKLFDLPHVRPQDISDTLLDMRRLYS